PGVEDVLKGVLEGGRAVSAGHGQQVQVVVAEDGAKVAAQILAKTQGVEGAGAPVDQVPHCPELIPARLEADAVQQSFKTGQAPLDIPYRVDGHALSSIDAAGHGQQEGCDGCVEGLAAVPEEMVAAFHGA